MADTVFALNAAPRIYALLSGETVETTLLKDQGYLFFHNSKSPINARSHNWNVFCRYWDNLAIDQYLPTRFGSRARRHSRLIWSPRDSKLTLVENIEFVQAPEHNCLFGGVRRKFSPIQPEAIYDPIFILLLQNELAILNLEKCVDWIIDLDFMRTISGDVPGYPCPEGRHQDGYEYIGIHFIGMHNVSTPRTELTNARGTLVRALYLDTPGQLLVIDDKLHYHYTHPFRALSAEKGWRDTMLTGYRRKL